MIRFRSVRDLPGKIREFSFREFIEKKLDPKSSRTFFGFYLACVTLLAVAGYTFILLFPLLLFAGVLNIYHAITASNGFDWQGASIWLAISVASGLISFRYIQYKPSLPAGLNLIEEKAPELFNLVQQIRSHFKRPAIHRIVITPDYQLDIVKTPVLALPVWSQNTLLVGLPVLQCLSPYQFECLMARRLGQFSKRDNLLMNWLYQMRSIWRQYAASLAKQKGIGVEPLRYFFTFYAPLYSKVSVHAARRDELYADFYAMDLYNDEEVRDMITTDAVCEYYLRTRYWPAVDKIAALQTKTIPTPHKNMTTAIQANLTGGKLPQLVNETLKLAPDRRNPVPTLRARIENIGHEHAHMDEPGGITAAVHYLGNSMIGITTLIDKLWLQTWLERRKRQQRQNHEQIAVTEVTSV